MYSKELFFIIFLKPKQHLFFYFRLFMSFRLTNPNSSFCCSSSFKKYLFYFLKQIFLTCFLISTIRSTIKGIKKIISRIEKDRSILQKDFGRDPELMQDLYLKMKLRCSLYFSFIELVKLFILYLY